MEALSGSTRKSCIPLFERLQIESQSNCNRSCWFCPRTYDRSGKYLDARGKAIFNRMPTEKIVDLLDQAQALGYRGRVGFHHYSEPLLDERNVMLACEASKRDMRPYLHTNGDVLKHDSKLCEHVKEVYELIVIGLYDYTTNEELEETKHWWHDRLRGANLKFSAIGLFGAGSTYSMGIPKALVPTDSRMAIPDLTYSNGPCHRPLIRLIIQYDGQMCNCCEDTCGAFKLGNAYERSLQDLWFSPEHIKVVQDLVAGRRQNYGLCGNCPQSPTAQPPDGTKVALGRRRYHSEGTLA